MKTLVITLAALVLFLFSPWNLVAQSQKVRPNPLNPQNLERHEEIREQIEERIQSRIEERTEMRATREARLTERRRVQIRTYFGRLTGRLGALTERLNILTDRIESRLDKIAEDNEDIDTVSIEAEVEEAKEALADTEATLSALDAELFLSEDDPKEAFVVVRETIQEIKQDLIEVHGILVHVIGDIKGLRVGITEQPNSATLF